MITKKIVADKLAGYLHHELTINELVDWAEQAMMEEDFVDNETETIRNVVTRLGLADVRNFGLTWEDCQELLRQLGFQVHVQIVAV